MFSIFSPSRVSFTKNDVFFHRKFHFNSNYCCPYVRFLSNRSRGFSKILRVLVEASRSCAWNVSILRRQLTSCQAPPAVGHVVVPHAEAKATAAVKVGQWRTPWNSWGRRMNFDSCCHRLWKHLSQQLLRILSAVVTEAGSSCHGIWQLPSRFRKPIISSLVI